MGKVCKKLDSCYSEHSKSELTEYFECIKWHLFLSGHYTRLKNWTPEGLDQAFANWRSIAARVTGMRVATVGCVVDYHNLHSHALCVGRSRDGQTLLDIDDETINQLQRIWYGIAGDSCLIEKVWSDEVSDYIVGKNILDGDVMILNPHGLSLLRKLREEELCAL